MTVPNRQAPEPSSGRPATLLKKIAHNAATESDNKIHDDAEAKRLGLRGGLVPGVTLYAYLTELMLPLLGPDWVRSGTCSVRFVRPVYEGDEVTCAATLTSFTSDPARGPVSYDLAVQGPDGGISVVGSAVLDLRAPLTTEADVKGVNAPVEEKPLLTLESAPIGSPLAARLLLIDADVVEAYATEVDDPNPWYRGGSPFGLPLVPPGLLAGQPARLLRQNFSFGPSVHTASEIQHLGIPLAGGQYRIDATLRETFSKRGNDYLVADVMMRDHNDAAVTRIRHTSIFRFASRT